MGMMEERGTKSASSITFLLTNGHRPWTIFTNKEEGEYKLVILGDPAQTGRKEV
jgi:hypothetical protein